jgi:hypothetical protein
MNPRLTIIFGRVNHKTVRDPQDMGTPIRWLHVPHSSVLVQARPTMLGASSAHNGVTTRIVYPSLAADAWASLTLVWRMDAPVEPRPEIGVADPTIRRAYDAFLDYVTGVQMLRALEPERTGSHTPDALYVGGSFTSLGAHTGARVRISSSMGTPPVSWSTEPHESPINGPGWEPRPKLSPGEALMKAYGDAVMGHSVGDGDLPLVVMGLKAHRGIIARSRGLGVYAQTGSAGRFTEEATQIPFGDGVDDEGAVYLDPHTCNLKNPDIVCTHPEWW